MAGIRTHEIQLTAYSYSKNHDLASWNFLSGTVHPFLVMIRDLMEMLSGHSSSLDWNLFDQIYTGKFEPEVLRNNAYMTQLCTSLLTFRIHFKGVSG